MVMERFPRLRTERTCRTEREMRRRARESYYQRLKNELLAELGTEQDNGTEQVPEED